MGNSFWPYVSKVVLTESGFGLASLVLWASVLFMSTCTVTMFNTFTVAGTFLFFSIFTIIGGIILTFHMVEAIDTPLKDVKFLYRPKGFVENEEKFKRADVEMAERD
jgi:hypothetical protein